MKYPAFINTSITLARQLIYLMFPFAKSEFTLYRVKIKFARCYIEYIPRTYSVCQKEKTNRLIQDPAMVV